MTDRLVLPLFTRCYLEKRYFLDIATCIINKLVRLIAVTVCGAANVNKTKDTTHAQG